MGRERPRHSDAQLRAEASGITLHGDGAQRGVLQELLDRSVGASAIDDGDVDDVRQRRHPLQLPHDSFAFIDDGNQNDVVVAFRTKDVQFVLRNLPVGIIHAVACLTTFFCCGSTISTALLRSSMT